MCCRGGCTGEYAPRTPQCNHLYNTSIFSYWLLWLFRKSYESVVEIHEIRSTKPGCIIPTGTSRIVQIITLCHVEVGMLRLLIARYLVEGFRPRKVGLS